VKRIISLVIVIAVVILTMTIAVGAPPIEYDENGIEIPIYDEWGHRLPIYRDMDGNPYRPIIPEQEKGGIRMPEFVYALPTEVILVADGTAYRGEAVNIRGNNYMRIRDIAKVLNFDVTLEDYDLCIWLHREYQGEYSNIAPLSASRFGDVPASLNRDIGIELYDHDDPFWNWPGTRPESIWYMPKYQQRGHHIRHESQFFVYNIHDNNFIRLRDIARIVDVGLAWDPDTGYLHFNTDISYYNRATIDDVSPDRGNNLTQPKPIWIPEPTPELPPEPIIINTNTRTSWTNPDPLEDVDGVTIQSVELLSDALRVEYVVSVFSDAAYKKTEIMVENERPLNPDGVHPCGCIYALRAITSLGVCTTEGIFCSVSLDSTRARTLGVVLRETRCTYLNYQLTDIRQGTHTSYIVEIPFEGDHADMYPPDTRWDMFTTWNMYEGVVVFDSSEIDLSRGVAWTANWPFEYKSYDHRAKESIFTKSDQSF